MRKMSKSYSKGGTGALAAINGVFLVVIPSHKGRCPEHLITEQQHNSPQ
jgi:hypothetical protein